MLSSSTSVCVSFNVLFCCKSKTNETSKNTLHCDKQSADINYMMNYCGKCPLYINPWTSHVALDFLNLSKLLTPMVALQKVSVGRVMKQVMVSAKVRLNTR